MKHERLWTMRNKLRASEGRGVGEWDRLVMVVRRHVLHGALGVIRN